MKKNLVNRENQQAAIEARKASLKVDKEISLTMKDGKGKNFEKTFSD